MSRVDVLGTTSLDTEFMREMIGFGMSFIDTTIEAPGGGHPVYRVPGPELDLAQWLSFVPKPFREVAEATAFKVAERFFLSKANATSAGRVHRRVSVRD